LDAVVLRAVADKVLTPERLKEMLGELTARLKALQVSQDDQVRTLQRELGNLELATGRLYEAVLVEIARARRAREMPLAAVTSRRLEAISTALRSRLLAGGNGFPKHYLRQFVSEIRFDGKRLTMTGCKDVLLAPAGEREMGTTTVPISGQSWLPDLGSNQGPTD
jgi:hypothetical protein